MKNSEDLAQRAFDLGQKYEKKYTGCAQMVIAALFKGKSIERSSNRVFPSLLTLGQLETT